MKIKLTLGERTELTLLLGEILERYEQNMMFGTTIDKILQEDTMLATQSIFSRIDNQQVTQITELTLDKEEIKLVIETLMTELTSAFKLKCTERDLWEIFYQDNEKAYKSILKKLGV